MVPDHQVRRKWSGDASKKVQLYKVGGSRIIGTAVSRQNLLNGILKKAKLHLIGDRRSGICRIARFTKVEFIVNDDERGLKTVFSPIGSISIVSVVS